MAVQSRYFNNFPSEVPVKAAQGFLVSAAINLYFDRNNLNRALLGGALSATATLIEAVTRPIVRSIFPNNTFIARSVQITLPNAIVLGVAMRMEDYIGIAYKPRASASKFSCMQNFFQKCC